MSYLNKFKIKFKKKIRVGRGIGSGLGKTCGRGHKGQKSRAGYSKNFLFEGGQTPLNIRLPKFGFKKIKKNKKTLTLNNLKNITNININNLKKNKIIKKYIKYVKIIHSKNFYTKINITDKKINISNKIKNLL